MNISAGKETPAAYLEKYIFPVLLSGIEETLQVAKRTEVRSMNYKSITPLPKPSVCTCAIRSLVLQSS